MAAHPPKAAWEVFDGEVSATSEGMVKVMIRGMINTRKGAGRTDDHKLHVSLFYPPGNKRLAQFNPTGWNFSRGVLACGTGPSRVEFRDGDDVSVCVCTDTRYVFFLSDEHAAPGSSSNYRFCATPATVPCLPEFRGHVSLQEMGPSFSQNKQSTAIVQGRRRAAAWFGWPEPSGSGSSSGAAAQKPDMRRVQRRDRVPTTNLRISPNKATSGNLTGTRVPNGMKVEVLMDKGMPYTYALVSYQGQKGWINRDYLSTSIGGAGVSDNGFVFVSEALADLNLNFN